MDEGLSSDMWDRVPCAVRMRSAVHMRRSDFDVKTFLNVFLDLKEKCVEHERGYSSIGRALALQARGSEIDQDLNLESPDP